MTPRHLHFCFPCVLCGSISTAQAQSIRFFGRPAEVFEGDAVVLTYRTDLAGLVPLSQIGSWKWDFNADNVWDQEITVIRGPGWFLWKLGSKDGQPLVLANRHADEGPSQLRVRKFPAYFHQYRADEFNPPSRRGDRRNRLEFGW